MSADITANPENTVFQVNKKGVYLLSYRVNLTQPAQVGTKLILNSMARTTSSVIPVVPTASFENQYTHLMNAGETLRLQLCAAPPPQTFCKGSNCHSGRRFFEYHPAGRGVMKGHIPGVHTHLERRLFYVSAQLSQY